jgi:hypothetical protein
MGARQDTVSQAAKVLKSSGTLIVIEHNPENPLTRRAVRDCPFDQNARLLPPGETRGYVSGAGLPKVHVKYIVFFPHFLRWLRPLEPHLGKCRLGAQYMVAGCRA